MTSDGNVTTEYRSGNTVTPPVELLAPAGSLTMLKAVIAAGADAVYIGGSRFGARAYADNPGETALLDGLDYAHLRGVRVYLTVNTLLKSDELDEVVPFVKPYVERGLDGVLIQDMGVARVLRRAFPDLPLHTSTQMTVTGPEGASLMKRHGFTRVVPARELTLKELKAIHDVSGLEVEAFVHGALCYCYSGQCLLSSMIGGRSGNRGRCAQPCRLLYEADGVKGSLLSPKDLCVIDRLPDLIEAGVCSLKIEGRMKQPAYAAGVTAIYRKYLDLALAGTAPYRVKPSDRAALEALFNREGHTGGYLTEHNGPDMMAMKESGGRAAADPILEKTIKEKYLDREKKVSVSGKAVFRPGECPSLTLRSGEAEIRVRGNDPVGEAVRQPVTAERIAQQLNKTGGTDFDLTDLTVDAADGIFVPVGALNDLRRRAFDELRKVLLAPYCRTCEAAPQPEKAESQTAESRPPAMERAHADHTVQGCFASDRKYQDPPRVIKAALCETEEQFAALAEQPEIAILYYPLELLLEAPDPLKKAADLAEGTTQAVYLAMPFVDRLVTGSPVGRELPEDFGEKILKAGFRGFLVRSLETYARLARKGLSGCCRLDTSLYAWTEEAAAFYKETGAEALTAPQELNKKELLRNTGLYDEIVVYGRQPVMVSAQCLHKNTTGCLMRTAGHYLTDRTNRSFYVKNVCAFCYNVIYNSVPLSLDGCEDVLARMRIPVRRYAFTDETPAVIRRIISSGGAAAEKAHTRGHYGRGVE